jgi:hypothetical protein
MSATAAKEFRFRFDRRYQLAAWFFGITNQRALIRVMDQHLTARFGPWKVRTPLVNVRGVSLTGPYRFVKTAGPAHLSLADHGLTFATNGDRGVCLEFVEPITGLDPFGVLRHPNLTVTVIDIPGLVDILEQRHGPLPHPTQPSAVHGTQPSAG